MSEWNYFVTAQRPTAVTHVLGQLRFTSPEPVDLIVARLGRLQVSRFDTAQGCLVDVCEFPVNGRLTVLLQVKADGQDMLLMCTEKRQISVIRWQAGLSNPVAVAVGNVEESASRPVEHAPFSCVDASGEVVSVYMYDGLLTVISLVRLAEDATADSPVDLNKSRRVFNAHLVEPRVMDIAFLRSAGDAARPVLVVLHSDYRGRSLLSTCVVDSRARDLNRAPGLLRETQLQPGCSRLAPLPSQRGGVIAVGGGAVVSLDRLGPFRCAPARANGGPQQVTALAAVDPEGTHWVVCGTDGSVWLLSLQAVGCSSSSTSLGGATTISMSLLGTASPARAVACLPLGRIFVGSAVADSQLLRVLGDPSPNGTRLSVDATWSNLGPVTDFCIAELDGRQQVVTCSGVGRTGSLRSVRIGVSVTELGVSDGFHGVLGMWSLGGVILVLSFVGCTRVLALNTTAELVEHKAPGFTLDEETLLCFDDPGFALQVTRSQVRAALPGSLLPLAEWAPPAGVRIQAATATSSGVLVALGNCKLMLVGVAGECSAEAPVVLRTATLEDEATCLASKGSLCVACTWSQQLHVFRTEDLSELSSEALPKGAVSRSAVFATLAGSSYLFVGLSDGRLASFRAHATTGKLSDRRMVSVGLLPLRLCPFRPEEQSNEEQVFLAGDRPTIVHARSYGQLAYSTVAMGRVTCAAALQVPGSRCLAFISDNRLLFRAFDDVNRVVIRTTHLGESPYRVVYLPQARTTAVACRSLLSEETEWDQQNADGFSSLPVPDTKNSEEACGCVRIFGPQLKQIQSLSLSPREIVGSLSCITFDGDPQEYLVVGTALLDVDPEPRQGRILLYAAGTEPGSTRFNLVSLLQVDGAIYQLLPFQGMLLGAVNNLVTIWRWSHQQLECVCYRSSNIIALSLQAVGDLILVADLMRPASLLRFRCETSSLESVASDVDSSWLTCAAMMNESVFVCMDDSHNAHVLALRDRQPPLLPLRGEESKLARVGLVHLGEFVNCLHRGMLVQPPPLVGDSLGVNTGSAEGLSYAPVHQLVWSSVDGAIGLIASLRGEREFSRLLSIQEAVSEEVDSFGLSHGQWRDWWRHERGSVAHKGFVDGNVLEMLLEFTSERQESVVRRLVARGFATSGVDELLREVEELARLH